MLERILLIKLERVLFNIGAFVGAESERASGRNSQHQRIFIKQCIVYTKSAESVVPLVKSQIPIVWSYY